MISAMYEGWIARSNTNGGHWYTDGVREVFVDLIPSDAPQDWSMGPKMVPGQYGAFLSNPIHPRGHSPYAFATGKTEEDARGKVSGFFRAKVSDWKPVEEPEFEWEET